MKTTSYVETLDANDDRVRRLSGVAVARYRALLLRRRGDQMARLAELETGEDPSAIDEHAAITQRLVRDELSQIESALARLKTGAYGSCERCGDDIPYDRLDAIPHVHTCLACAG